MKTQKVAVVGTGSSAEKFISTVSSACSFTFFNSTGSGECQGQPVYALNQLVHNEFDKVVLAVYDYGELLPLIENSDKAPLYWFDAKNTELALLTDPYFDNAQACRQKTELLTVIYDMRIAPPTYDFVVFLIKSQLVAQERGLKGLRVIIAPGDKQGFRDNIDFFSQGEMAFRVSHLLLPLIKLVDPGADIFLCSNREDARDIYFSACHRFPDSHNFVKPIARHFYSEFFEAIDKGIEHRLIRASETCRERIAEWMRYSNIAPQRAITLTLRESTAHNDRNSELAIWHQVATALTQAGYRVIVVRDTAKALFPLGWQSIDEFPVAALDVEMRTALYEQSWLNLGVCNGPAVLCFLMAQCRYLFFGMYNASCTSNTYEHLEKVGIKRDRDQIAGAGDGQYICWDDITAENVLFAIQQKFGVTIQ
ncbi:hypothetical protein [Alteromonas lipolytica]|uniref:Uncharacterized protein n=1 Tax=Alteromonas lipolytica TaxID=1856405 RepID=A0A1E8FFA4_9ALTE|nr:hypothetical protein [Alteromonas lipolytica]OFI34590.1 hypothetical protein BFC17_13405 [Alteromonas lipolytica]GGF52317.1 hypothetical protein GCM10011338_00550 [Alteromonas lipolytica]